jgi:hypothetical protein
VTVWHWLVHFFGADYGAAYGRWVPYDFWSGVSGSFVVGVVVWSTLWWYHGTCHSSPRCLRRGRHEAAGGVFKLCWKHHPDMGERPHGEMIARLHREHLERAR